MPVEDIPLAPGITGQVLHPLNVATAVYAVVYHTLSAFSPNTLVVKRVRRSGSGGVDDESRAHSHHHHRRGGGSVIDDGASSVAGSVAARSETSHQSRSHRHQHHRSSSSTTGDREERREKERSHRHGSSSDVSRSHSRGDASGTSQQQRRSRSAEDAVLASSPSAAAQKEATQRESTRRSRSDSSTHSRHRSSSGGSRSRSHRDGLTSSSHVASSEGSVAASVVGEEDRHHGDGDDDAAGSRAAAAAPHPSSLATPAPGEEKSVGPLAMLPPPPPLALGKPPLSGRRSKNDDPSGTTRRPHRDSSADSRGRRQSSSAGLSSSSAHRHRRRDSDTDGKDTKTDSGASAVGEEGKDRTMHRSSSKDERKSSKEDEKTSKKTRKTLRQRLAACNATKVAYLLAHIMRAVPVSCLHFFCQLEKQMATVPMLAFQDQGAGGAHFLSEFIPLITTKTKLLSAAAEIRFSSSKDMFVFLFIRAALAMVGHYLEDTLFLDSSIVVRNLRSHKLSRRYVGWALRLISHAFLDTLLMSIISPLLCMATERTPTLDAVPLRCTVGGFLRGVMNGMMSSLIQWVVMPVVSQLVNRATVTVLEAGEYVVFRRYAHWPNEGEDDDFTTSDEEEDDDDAVSYVSGRSAAGDVNESVDTVATGVTSKSATSTKAGTALRKSGTRNTSSTRRKQRLLTQAQRRQARAQRREQCAREEHRNVLRSIAYRICGSLVAQCLVDHPLGVFSELLRARAMMHVVGTLRMYDDVRPGTLLSWAQVKHFFNLPRVVADAAKQAGPEDATVPPPVLVLRDIGEDIGHEITMVLSSIRDASGQAEAIDCLAHKVLAEGRKPSAQDSWELLTLTAFSFSPMFYGVQFSVLDKLLGFYVAVWTRLTRQT